MPHSRIPEFKRLRGIYPSPDGTRKNDEGPLKDPVSRVPLSSFTLSKNDTYHAESGYQVELQFQNELDIGRSGKNEQVQNAYDLFQMLQGRTRLSQMPTMQRDMVL